MLCNGRKIETSEFPLIFSVLEGTFTIHFREVTLLANLVNHLFQYQWKLEVEL